MTLSYSALGKNGRLGNCCFQIAATIGISARNGLSPVFPSWEYEQYFETPLPHGPMNTNEIREEAFTYNDVVATGDQDLLGYFQSKKYWEHNEVDVLRQFKFIPEFEGYFKSRSLMARVFDKEVIAIHVRRGDYVNNINYYNLPVEYYMGALNKFFPWWKTKNILVLSDDIPYAKTMFPQEANIFYSEGNSPIDDLALMSLADNWIIANSSFSWWGAYLGNARKPGTIVYPAHHFDGPLKEGNPDLSDYYPKEWKIFDHEEKGKEITAESFKGIVKKDSLKIEEPKSIIEEGSPAQWTMEDLINTADAKKTKIKKEKVIKPAVPKKPKKSVKK